MEAPDFGLNQSNISDFNGSQLKIQRIGDAILYCRHARYSEKLLQWYDGLLSIQSEVQAYFDSNESTENKRLLASVIVAKNKIVASSKVRANVAESFWTFYEYECFLMASLAKHGLDVSIRDDPRFAAAGSGR